MSLKPVDPPHLSILFDTLIIVLIIGCPTDFTYLTFSFRQIFISLLILYLILQNPVYDNFKNNLEEAIKFITTNNVR